ncbi:hypothetical protein T265_10780, partial [Opisthorchis viverrini]
CFLWHDIRDTVQTTLSSKTCPISEELIHLPHRFQNHTHLTYHALIKETTHKVA